MCDKAILENDETLNSVLTATKIKNCVVKQSCNYLHALEIVPKSYKTQKMGIITLNKCFLAFLYVRDRYKTHEMCVGLFLKIFYRFFFLINIRLSKCVMKLLMIV